MYRAPVNQSNIFNNQPLPLSLSLPLLNGPQLLKAKRLGRKTGKGFYTYGKGKKDGKGPKTLNPEALVRLINPCLAVCWVGWVVVASLPI